MSDRQSSEHRPLTGVKQPTRAAVLANPRVHLLDHPLAQDLLGYLRDHRTTTSVFGAIATQLARQLLWEACRDVHLNSASVPNFEGHAIAVQRIGERIAGVTILRAGIIFTVPFREIFPEVPLYQIGARRDEQTLQPAVYSANLPEQANWADRVLLLDPMLATGGSVIAALDVIRQTHPGPVSIITLVSAPTGVATVLDADHVCTITTAALDERLNARGYIIPGLGDAGDRLFGTGR